MIEDGRHSPGPRLQPAHGRLRRHCNRARSRGLSLAREQRRTGRARPDVAGVSGPRYAGRSRTTRPRAPSRGLLTARSEEIDRVVGFELGRTTTYQAVQRAGAGAQDPRRAAPSESRQSRPTGRFWMLRIDRDAHRVWVDAERWSSRPRVQAAVTLYDRRNRVHLAALCSTTLGHRHSHSTRTVDAHVKSLREKMVRRATTSRPCAAWVIASPDPRARQLLKRVGSEPRPAKSDGSLALPCACLFPKRACASAAGHSAAQAPGQSKCKLC